MQAFIRLSVLAAGMASLYSLVLVVSSWVWRIRNERESETEKEGEETPSKHLIVWVLVWRSSSRASLHYCCWTAWMDLSLSLSPSAHYIILLVESVLFGVFVMVIFYDQVRTLMSQGWDFKISLHYSLNMSHALLTSVDIHTLWY